jgi:hypothetical protein
MATLHLSELTDLAAVFPGVLTRVDPLRLQFIGRGTEDLGEVSANPFLAVVLSTTVLHVGAAMSRGRIDVRVSHVPNFAMTRVTGEPRLPVIRARRRSVP